MHKKLFTLLVLTSLTAFSSDLLSHHSFAPHFDPDKIVTIKGVLTELEYRNPHSFVSLDVPTQEGIEDWYCEMNASSYLSREGFTRDSFKIGEEVTLVGSLSRVHPTECRVYRITADDGRLMELFKGAAPDDAIVGFESPNTDMFGTWLIKPGTDVLGPNRIVNDHVGPNLFESQLTEAGRIAHEAYDQTTDDPSLNCMMASPWRAWDDPQSAIAIESGENSVLIRFELFDGLREIYLDKTAHPDDLALSPLGHSFGRFEGDTLIVDTIGFSTGVWIPHPGVLMTSDAHMTEQIWFDEDTGELRVTWQLDEPHYFSSPLIGEFAFESANVEVSQYNCVAEGH